MEAAPGLEPGIKDLQFFPLTIWVRRPHSTLLSSSVLLFCHGFFNCFFELKTGEDVERIGKVRDEAHHNGLALVLWSYPRGPVPDPTKKDSLLWCHYAVSAAESLGADIVKTKFPSVVEPKKRENYEGFIEKEYCDKI
ncbi:unnamed protein product, partial [marine sediment metagenome]